MSPHDLAALRRQSEALLGGEEPRGSAQDVYGLVRDLSGFLQEATLEELAGAAFPEETEPVSEVKPMKVPSEPTHAAEATSSPLPLGKAGAGPPSSSVRARRLSAPQSPTGRNTGGRTLMSDPAKDPTEPVKGEEHLSEHQRLARRLNLPDSWVKAVEETRRVGPKLVEEWEAKAREERVQGERRPNG